MLFFGLTQSDTLRPELADHFGFRALNGAGTSRRVTALAEIVPCHVSAIPGLLRAGRIRVDVALIQVKPLGPPASPAIALSCSTSSCCALVAARRCSRRHLNSTLALIPFSSAIPDTEAPGCRQRSTSSRLKGVA